jgi:hypothetical protein
VTPGTNAFPILRWLALLWIVTWLPLNVCVWGWANLMHICDIGVVLACIGLWLGNSLLISSQALSSLSAGVLWSLDVGWRLVTGHHLVGGTEYMRDPTYPLGVRLQSTFHLALPLVLLWAMHKLGYERRALGLQSAIAGAVLIFSRFLPRALNMNYAYQDPLFHRAWGPVPAHLAIILAAMVGVLYWPTHLLLSWMYPTPGEVT